ncbi:hypothetical protein Tco_0448035 [Tanacetum coccineum]
MIVMTSMIELKSLFNPLFDEYLNVENQVVSKSFAVTTPDASDKHQQQTDSTSSTSTLATTVTADGNFEFMEILLEPTSNKLLVGLDDGVAASFQRSRIHKPHAHTQAFKVNPQVDQGSQIKMIHVKEMMQDNDLKNSKSKDKGSRSRSQSMNDQSHYKQDKTKTRQSINVKSHIFNVIGSTEEFEERDLNIGGDCCSDTSAIAPVIFICRSCVETTLDRFTHWIVLVSFPIQIPNSDSPDENDLYIMVVARWRSKVASHPSSSSEFTIAPVIALPWIRRRLAWRYISPSSSDHRPSSSSSSSDSLPVHSSGLNAPDQGQFSGILTKISGNISSYHDDLLPPRRGSRYSYSSKASIEEDTEIDPIRDTKVGINLMSAPIVEEETVKPAREESFDSSGTRDSIVRSLEDIPIDLDDAVHDFYHHMSKVRTDTDCREETESETA